MTTRRRFLERAGTVIGAYLARVSGVVCFGDWRVALAATGDRPEFAWHPEAAVWSVKAGGTAPWSANDLSFSMEVDGQKHSFDHAVEVLREAAPDGDIFGFGKATRYVLQRQGSRPTIRLILSAYERATRFRVHYQIQNDTGKDIRLGEVKIAATLSSPGWAGPLRVFVNSGNQGPSGSRPIEAGGRSAYLGMVIPRRGASNLLAGFISYRRADSSLSFERARSGGVAVSGSVAYNNLRLPAGQTLLGEDLELLASLNPHELVEGYADEVARMHKVQFNRDLTGMWNLWYAYWDPSSSQVGPKQILQGAEILDRTLGKYGIRYIASGVWQNRAAFGEREPWPGNFPDGLGGTVRALRQRGYGLMNGGFTAKVSSCTEVFKQHPQWLVRNAEGQPLQLSKVSWGACPFPSYALDITHPEAAAWYRDWARDLVAGGAVDYIWMDFEGTTAGGHYDDTVCAPFETDRQRISIVRKALGPGGKIGTYTSPTNRYLGLVDRVRLGSDAGKIDLNVPADKRWDFLMTCFRNMSAGYFYHGKFWWNDPDPGMPGDQELSETIEEGRCRMLYASLTGSFVTIGQRIPEIAPSRLRLLKMGLPPMGIAARPLDLFATDVAGIYDWRLKNEWDEWHVLTLINWSAHEEQRFDLKLADLEIKGAHWVYELWTEKYLGEVVGTVSFTIPARASRVFVLRSARHHPWFLATDLHVGMGYHELKQVNWDHTRRVLSCVVDRPLDLDMSGQVIAVIPSGWRLADSSAGWVEGEIVRIPVRFTHGPVNLSLRFERSQDGSTGA